jgi:hypothetical protein
MQKDFNELNKTAKIYDVEMSVFKNKGKRFSCKNIQRAKLLIDGSTWNENNLG